jgi:hypothetical protein
MRRSMPNTRRFSLQTPPDTHGPHTYADCCLARRQPIRTVVYPRVLNKQRRTARQLLLVEDNARALAGDFQPRFYKNKTLSLCTLLYRRRRSTALLDTISWRCILGEVGGRAFSAFFAQWGETHTLNWPK